MLFNATLDNISAILLRSTLLVDEIGVLGENHRPAAGYFQTSLHKVLSSTPHYERDSNSQL